MTKRADLVGKRFGSLVVLAYAKMGDRHDAMWKCLCDCGNVAYIKTGNLNSGNSVRCKSCGKRKHGMSGTKLYKVWQGMKTRCTNPDVINYARYGGRGIKYDPKWEKFEGFYEDMGQGYCAGLTIERKDNDGDYTKDNCVWVTPAMQNLNIPQNVYLTYNGKRQTITEWADELLLNRCILYHLKAYYPQWTDARLIEETIKRSYIKEASNA